MPVAGHNSPLPFCECGQWHPIDQGVHLENVETHTLLGWKHRLVNQTDLQTDQRFHQDLPGNHQRGQPQWKHWKDQADLQPVQLFHRKLGGHDQQNPIQKKHPEKQADVQPVLLEHQAKQ